MNRRVLFLYSRRVLDPLFDALQSTRCSPVLRFAGIFFGLTSIYVPGVL